jgi:signal transduction histidine kinase
VPYIVLVPLIVAGVVAWLSLRRRSNASLAAALAAAEDMVAHAMRLQEVTSALSQAKTEGEVADVVLGDGLRVVECVRGVLARVDGGRFEVIRACGYEPRVESMLLAMTLDDPGALTHAVKTGEALWLTTPDAHLSQFPALYRQLDLAPPQASVGVPLRHGGTIVGALGLFFTDSKAFGAARQAFTMLLAQAAADALSRARSYDVERDARRGAETLAQARADVLGIVAHDLRNPLSVITAATDLLLEVEELPLIQRRRNLETMRRSARRMNRLIGDLLEATRLQAGRLSFDLADVDARKIVLETEESLAAAAAERRISLRAHAPCDAVHVRADEGRLIQVIGNLVGNALKFTPEGGNVTVSAQADVHEVVFSVADTGPGIPLEDQAQLFDSFWQARKGDRRGVGLGLSITRDIVTALGGRVWVESAVGAGSTFYFALPSAAPMADVTAVQARYPAPSAAAPEQVHGAVT